jgi:hypothetical protein
VAPFSLDSRDSLVNGVCAAHAVEVAFRVLVATARPVDEV